MDNFAAPEIFIAVFVVVFTSLLLFLLKRRFSGPPRNSVLLVGLSGSGKTALLSQLIHNHASYTVASIIANVAEYHVPTGKKRTIRLCDLPGEDRVRAVSLDTHLPNALGIVFVIDSPNLQSSVKAAAKCLYDVLTNDAVVRNRTALLIACNKQDISTAASSDAVRRTLENELGVLCRTYLGTTETNTSNLLNYKQSGQSKVREMTADIRASRAASARIIQIFGDPQNVSFDKVGRHFPVRFVECSAGQVDETLSEPNGDALKKVSKSIDALREWIASL